VPEAVFELLVSGELPVLLEPLLLLELQPASKSKARPQGTRNLRIINLLLQGFERVEPVCARFFSNLRIEDRLESTFTKPYHKWGGFE
jgi:hypothetical protein